MDSFLKTKRALVVPKGAGTQNRTFLYSVAFGVLDPEYFPKNSGWVTNKLTKKIIENYTFDFFTPDDGYKTKKIFFESFENKFNISVLVLCYEPKTNKIFCKKLMNTEKTKQAVVLELPDGTYACVKSLSRLLATQVSTTKGSRHICIYCLNDFSVGSQKIKTHKCQKIVPEHFKKPMEPTISPPREPLTLCELTLPQLCLEYDEFIGCGGWSINVIFKPEYVSEYEPGYEPQYCAQSCFQSCLLGCCV